MLCFICKRPLIEKDGMYYCEKCNVETDYDPGIKMATEKEVNERYYEELRKEAELCKIIIRCQKLFEHYENLHESLNKFGLKFEAGRLELL